jgi:hypothetical protein
VRRCRLAWAATATALPFDDAERRPIRARAAAANEIASGRMAVRHVTAEDFELQPGEAPYDLVFAVRVGALDSRNPTAGQKALTRIAASRTRAPSSTAAIRCASSRFQGP